MAKSRLNRLFDKMTLGKEKSEDYARSTLPSNRWELFGDIFKGRFGKIVIVNLLTCLFLIPIVLLLLFRSVLMSSYGMAYPFAQSFGIGYQAVPSMVGFAENIVFNVNLRVFLLMPLACVIGAVGISGGAYIIRNMVWTEGIFVANDFWKGVKQNFKQMLVIALLFSVFFYATVCANSLLAGIIATGGSWIWAVLRVIILIMFGFFCIMTLHMITMSVNYELTFPQLFKNAFIMSFCFILNNLFFIALGIIPFLLLLVPGLLSVIGWILVLIFGVSYFLLIWTDYCQWIYDKHINPKMGIKVGRGIYEKVSKDNQEAMQKYKEQAKYIRTLYNSRPIKPIDDDELKLEEIPETFNREDLEKLKKSKDVIYEDNERYIEEHKKDEEFARFNEDNPNRPKEISDRDRRIAAAKRELSKRKKK